MRNKLMCGLGAAVALVLLLFTVNTAVAITADELIEKNIQARGGLDKLRAIQSLTETGKVLLSGWSGGSMQMGFRQLLKRPGMMRTEESMQGMTSIAAFDGTLGWQLQPFGGRVDPEKLSADDAKQLKLAADLDGPLVDYKGKGYTVEYLGTEDVDGTDAHKLKVTMKDGDVQYVYLDPDYFLIIRLINQIRVRGVETEEEIDLGDYEQVNGVYFPFSIESGAKGSTNKYRKVTIEKAEANAPIDDQLFRFPSSSAK